MTILLTGIDGYMGWPVALRLSKTFPNERIIGVDNLARRKWVEEIGSVSATPIYSMEERLKAAKENGFNNIIFIKGDLVDKHFVEHILAIYKPHTIIHLAAQPSAPYSQINSKAASYTQFNNNQATINLLWAIKELNLNSHFIETTTTGVYGAPEFNIPEGFFEIEYKGKKDKIPFPSMAGSWYHMSKCNDVNNLLLAARQFKFPITDIRTSIVYGTSTKETIIDKRLSTRFDFDFYFGIVVNRFCAMALTGHPITIYGKGEQRKPMISIEDCTQSIVNTVKNIPKPGEIKVYNQVTEAVSITDLALAIKKSAEKLNINVEVKHIPNPRIEKEEHKMVIENEEFMKLLGNQFHTMETCTDQILKDLIEYKDIIKSHEDRFL